MSKTKKPKKGIVGGAVAAVVVISLIFGGSGGDTAEDVTTFDPSPSITAQVSETPSPSVSMQIDEPEETQDLTIETDEPEEQNTEPVETQSPIQSAEPVQSEEPSEALEEVDPEQAFRDQLLQYNYVGSSQSDRYHVPTCRWTSNINDENLVHFESTEEAEAAGYVPCGTCKPN